MIIWILMQVVIYEELVDQNVYWSMIGSLLYLMTGCDF
jgi:hypothetical protein